MRDLKLLVIAIITPARLDALNPACDGTWLFTNRVNMGGHVAPAVIGFGAGFGACRWFVGNDPSI